MSDPFTQPGHGPADPPGYSITIDGGEWVVVRIFDDAEIGRAESKEAAVELALADRATV